MTDRELAAAAWQHIIQSTVTGQTWEYRRVNGYKGKPYNIAATELGKAKALLDQIGATPLPPPSFPASFTTGPLGARNFIPKTAVIDYPGGDGATWALAQAQVNSRETAMGRLFDGVQTEMYWYKGDTGSAQAAEKRLEWINGRGQIPCLSAHTYYSIAEVNAGLQDAQWAAIADYLKSLNFPVMMRIWWEFNNTAGFPWSCGGSSSIGAPFIAAWQRVVGIFKQRGASNVGFWWCPTEGGDRAGTTASYPGDAYVDWVGSDVYSHCYASETGCWEGFAGPGWATFQQLALYTGQPAKSVYEQFSGRKPFVWGEVGCVLDPAKPELKAQWFTELAAALAGKTGVGVSFFDQDIRKQEDPVRSNWRVDWGAGSLSGFVDMAKALA